MQNKEITNTNKNNDKNIVLINQQTVALFKRKLKNLVKSLPKSEKINSGEKYNEILNFLCLNDSETLDENKFIQKLKDLKLIKNNPNTKYFISDEIKHRLEKSLLNTKYIFKNMTVKSKLNFEEKSKDYIIKEREILKEKLKNTTEITQKLLEFSDIKKI